MNNKSQVKYFVVYNQTKGVYLFNRQNDFWAPSAFLFGQGNIFDVFTKDALFENLHYASIAFSSIVKNQYPEDQLVIKEIMINMEVLLV